MSDESATPASAEAQKKLQSLLSTRDEELKTLKSQIQDLEKQLKKALKDKGPNLPTGDYASFGGKVYEITGNFRADNTFSEVKRGHCDEGCTLLSIARPH